MAAIVALTLADGQDTPSNHTFDVSTSQEGFNNPAVWYDKTASTFNGYIKISQLVKRTPNGTTTKVSLKIVKPVLDAEGLLKSSSLATLNFVLPDTGSLDDRKDLLAYAVNLLQDASVSDAVHNLNPTY